MATVIIKLLIGLFVWMVLPHILISKKHKKKKQWNGFISIACKIIGGIIILYGIINLIQFILNS